MSAPDGIISSVMKFKISKSLTQSTLNDTFLWINENIVRLPCNSSMSVSTYMVFMFFNLRFLVEG